VFLAKTRGIQKVIKRSGNDNDFEKLKTPAQRSFDFVSAIARFAHMKKDKNVRRVLRAIAANPVDSGLVGDLTKQISKYITHSKKFRRALRDHHPFAPHYPDARVTGPLNLGATFNPITQEWTAAGLHSHEISQHIWISGRSGAGKTNLIYHILRSLHRQAIPFFIFDYKRDFRHLTKIFDDVLVFNTRTFKINPFKNPQFTELQTWLHTLVNIIDESFFSSNAPASKNFLMQAVTKLCEEHGTFDGGDYPLMQDLCNILNPNNYKTKVPAEQREKMYRLQNKLIPLMDSLGEMFSDSEGLSLEELTKRNCVMEIDGSMTEHQSFLLSLLLFWFLRYHIDKGERSHEAKQVFIFDECKFVLGKDVSPTSHVIQFVSMAREFGLSLIASDQMPHAISEGLKSNVFTTISLSLSSTKDARAMSYALNLDEREKDLLQSLPVGVGVSRFADRYVRPFMLHVPLVKIRKDVTDGQVRKHMEQYFNPESPNPQSESNRKTDTQTTRTEIHLVQDSRNGLSGIETVLVKHIRDKAFLGTAERIVELGIGTSKATRTLRSLINKGFLTEVEISQRRGRPRKLYQFTSLAEKEFGKQNLGKGRGEFIHRYYQYRIQRKSLSLGHLAIIETQLKGTDSFADVGVFKPNKIKVAYEVGMSVQYEAINIQKDLAAGWDYVVCCYSTDAVGKKIRKEVSEVLSKEVIESRVSFVPVQSLVE